MAFEARRFAAENGWGMALGVIAFGLWRRVHNSVVRRALPGRPRIRMHPSAYVRGLSAMTISDGFHAGRQLWLEAVTHENGVDYRPTITIGRNVIVNDDVHIAATHDVRIGDDVLIASRVFISDHIHGDYRGQAQSDPETAPRSRAVTGDRSVSIEDNVWIGEMVSILPGVTIGRGSVIGAGSVVTRDVPPASIAVGSPARVIKRYDGSIGKWVVA